MNRKKILKLLECFEKNCVYNQENIPILIHIHNYINQIKESKNNIVFLSTKNPTKFISVFFASVLTKSSIFLLNPHWQRKELEQVYQLATPNFIFIDSDDYNIHHQLLEKNNSSLLIQHIKHEIIHTNKNLVNKNDETEKIMIPTGGTSGKIKFAIHTWSTLSNSAMGFKEFWQEEKINSFCCLPLYHVSGLMQIIRTFITGGNLKIYDYSFLKKEVPLGNYHGFFISLVPTQLMFFLDTNINWLKQFKTVLVGGSSTPLELQNICKTQKINLALTYGMTETASGVTILKPNNFLEGKKGSGKTLPHGDITIENNQEKFGKIIIKSSSLFKGYYPYYQDYSYFETDDLGYLDQNNYLHIIGRSSHKIISGGENIYPSEIENLIRETGLVKDVIILGKNDNYWGQIVCAIYETISEYNQRDIANNIKDKLRSHLSHYKIPKIWLKVDKIPRNDQGKINYHDLEKLVNHNDSE
ncbi:MAG: AMP-binding protein [Cyanobacterium sp.]